jgi:O-antigen/teichoic acid export membrane protein
VSDIKTRSTNAAIWSAIDKFGQQGIQFITGLIVARLLFPSDYGLIGMLAVFLAIPAVFVNSGFGSALIQKKTANATDYSTVFYFNIVVGLLLYFVLYLSAPLIADFYEEPQLVLLTRVLGLTFVFSSFAIIQSTILTKKLDFKTQTKISISSLIPSGIIGILFAYYGYGVWAIVFQSLSRQFLMALFFWLYNSWRPKLEFSIQSLKSLFAFGSNLLLSGLLTTFFTKIQFIVIGKVFNAELLGYYTRAKQFNELPSVTLNSIIGRISFPIFSTLQNDNYLLLK